MDQIPILLQFNKEIFITLSAVFWATALSNTSKFMPFNTANAAFFYKKEGQKALLRFLTSVFIINFLPALFFLEFYSMLLKKPSVFSYIFIFLAAFSFFGWQRILHSIIATDKSRTFFYSDDEIEIIFNEKWNKLFISDSFFPHALFGMIYLSLPYIYYYKNLPFKKFIFSLMGSSLKFPIILISIYIVFFELSPLIRLIVTKFKHKFQTYLTTIVKSVVSYIQKKFRN